MFSAPMNTPAKPPQDQPNAEQDPYQGNNRLTIPMPLSVEQDSDTVWQEFKEAEDKLEAQYAKTVFSELKPQE